MKTNALAIVLALALAVQLLEAPEHVLHAELVVLHQAFHSRHLHKLVVGSTL